MSLYKAVELAVDSFNEDRNLDLPTLTDIAFAMETTLLRIRKLLILADYFTSEIATEVQELDRQGKSIAEIMKETNLGKASVNILVRRSRLSYVERATCQD